MDIYRSFLLPSFFFKKEKRIFQDTILKTLIYIKRKKIIAKLPNAGKREKQQNRRKGWLYAALSEK